MSGAAHALTVAGDGTITNWGFKPFTSGVNNATTANQIVGGIYRTLANNYAPIAYLYEPPFTPSGDEPFDLEEMYARFIGSSLQVLVISSSSFDMAGAGYPLIKRGDLFVQLDAVSLGVVTQSQYAPGVLPPGNIYQILNPADVVSLQNIPGQSYFNIFNLVPNDYGPNDIVMNLAGPWAVAQNIPVAQKLTNTSTLQTASYNYGGVENFTSIFEYNIDLTGFTIPPNFLALSQTWGCGNDVIKIAVNIPQQGGDIPSPTAGILGGAMFLLLSLSVRSRTSR